MFFNSQLSRLFFFSLYKKKSERSSSGNRRCASVKVKKKLLFFLYPFCLAHNADNDERHTKHFKKKEKVSPLTRGKCCVFFINLFALYGQERDRSSKEEKYHSPLSSAGDDMRHWRHLFFFFFFFFCIPQWAAVDTNKGGKSVCVSISLSSYILYRSV